MLEFEVAARGGELSSLRLDGEELLHRPRPAGRAWRGGAPWLFPAVGRSALADGSVGFWTHAGRRLPMPIHGFAMERRWGAERDGAAIICRARSDAATRRMYPFGFELEARYEAAGAGLGITLRVRAASSNDAPMPFSIGNHLTLRAGPGCVLASPARVEELLTPGGLLSGGTRPARCAGGVALSAEHRNMVLGGYDPEACWAELERPGRWRLRVAQRAAGAPEGELRFVLWGDDAGAFFCPEPWCGRPNSLNDGRGLVCLPPGNEFAWELSVTASRAGGAASPRAPRSTRRA